MSEGWQAQEPVPRTLPHCLVGLRGTGREHGWFSSDSSHHCSSAACSPAHSAPNLCPWPQVTRSGVVLQLQQPVRRGDGVVFDAGRPQEAEQGGAIYDILPADGSRGASGGGRDSASPGEGEGAGNL